MNILTMQGMSLDPVLTPLGGIALKNQYAKLHDDIETLLLTKYGTTIGNPTYGSHLHEILFETGSNSTMDKVKIEVERVMLDNYNFIKDLEIECSMEESELHVSIDYKTSNANLSTKLEFNIPLSSEGGIRYE